jgi:hypothetical protein
MINAGRNPNSTKLRADLPVYDPNFCRPGISHHRYAIASSFVLIIPSFGSASALPTLTPNVLLFGAVLPHILLPAAIQTQII